MHNGVLVYTPLCRQVWSQVSDDYKGRCYRMCAWLLLSLYTIRSDQSLQCCYCNNISSIKLTKLQFPHNHVPFFFLHILQQLGLRFIWKVVLAVGRCWVVSLQLVTTSVSQIIIPKIKTYTMFATLIHHHSSKYEIKSYQNHEKV